MSFLEQIPDHIKTLRTEIGRLEKERADLDWGNDGHECDCEYCDRAGAGAKDGDPDVENKADAFDRDIASHKTMIKRMRDYSTRMGIELPTVLT